MDGLTNWLGREGFLPHGYCFTWSPEILWTMVIADGLIALSYFSIPIALVSFVRKRPEISFHWVFWLFSAFIFACGVTHVMDIWTIWLPDYRLEAFTKLVTALVSIITAVALWPLMPKALKIPSIKQLQNAINNLENEIQIRKDTEEALTDIKNSLAVSLAIIDGGMIATNRQGRITQMNPVAEKVTGWAFEEAKGLDFWKIWNPADKSFFEQYQNIVDEMIRNGTSADSVFRMTLMSRHGDITPLEIRAALTFNVLQQPHGMVMVFRDTSRLDKAESDSKRLVAIVESSNDAIISKSLDGTIRSWNSSAVAMFGYTPDEAIGRNIRMLIPKDRWDEESRIIQTMLQGQKLPHYETKRLRKNGQLIDVSITVSPLQDTEGRVYGVSKIARDISEKKRSEELRLDALRLEAENQKILAANRMKSEFLANMSHELRTP